MIPVNRWNREANVRRRGYYLFFIEKGVTGCTDRSYCTINGDCVSIRTYNDGNQEFDMWHDKDEKFLVCTGIMFRMEQRK